MFVGILGHDLRNPLAGITTAASLVLSRTESDRVIRPVNRILSSARRMSRMIDQILDFTRVRLGRGIPLQRKTMNLADVCQLVLDELETVAEGDMDVQLEVRGDTVGVWDEDRLAQLISNLAGNALQHRRSGTAVRVLVDGSLPLHVNLEVQNAGAIPPDLLPVIFEPLRGGEHGKRAGSSGLGLGLYISERIAAAHGGTIRAHSEAGTDHTRFTVELPRRPHEGDPVFSNGKEESK
jgi:signal transduction histidine kinase